MQSYERAGDGCEGAWLLGTPQQSPRSFDDLRLDPDLVENLDEGSIARREDTQRDIVFECHVGKIEEHALRPAELRGSGYGGDVGTVSIRQCGDTPRLSFVQSRPT